MNKSCLFLSAVLLLTGAPAYAGQAPFAADAPNFPISGETGSMPPSSFRTPSR